MTVSSIDFNGEGGYPFTDFVWFFYLEDHGGTPQVFQAQIAGVLEETAGLWSQSEQRRLRLQW